MNEVSVPVSVSSNKRLLPLRNRSRFVLFFWIIFGLVLASYLSYYFITKSSEKLSVSAIVPISTLPAASEETKPAKVSSTVSRPNRLIIAKLNINTPIDSVGRLPSGQMATPPALDQPAWYSLGFKPGELGSAVIAGHLNGKGNVDGIFIDLGNLVAGDIISIEDEVGQLYTFKTIESRTYPYNNAPIAELFGSQDKKILRLVTCDGRWDRDKKTYTERLVVTAEQIPSKTN